jgi:hypothetical protein
VKNRLLAVLVVLIALVVSSPVSAGLVQLVPSALTVAPGSSVTVSVNLEVSPDPITMTAVSAILNYDPAVFDFVSFVRGPFLDPSWDLVGAVSTPGELRLGAYTAVGCDPDIPGTCPPLSQTFTPGTAGTMFTFTLLARTGAALGPSAVTWGDAGTGVPGFDYGDEKWFDVVPTSFGTSIDVVEASVPDPGSSLLLLGIGLVGLRALRKRW